METQHKHATKQDAAWNRILSETGAPADRLAEMLGLRIPILADHGFTAMAKRYGMRRLDLKALACIAQLEPLPTGRLVQILGMSPGGVAAILDRLERDGRIRRDRSVRDRRQVSLCLARDSGSDYVFPEYAVQPLQEVIAERSSEDVERLLAFLAECLRALNQDAEHQPGPAGQHDEPCGAIKTHEACHVDPA